jgi:hypothetical protein
MFMIYSWIKIKLKVLIYPTRCADNGRRYAGRRRWQSPSTCARKTKMVRRWRWCREAQKAAGGVLEGAAAWDNEARR